jgi:exosortase H (IPTLxxWG-CTERM-specific)
VQLRFALVFAAVAAVLLSIYAFPYSERGAVTRAFDAYLSGYAHMAGALLSLFDRHVSVTGTMINGRYALRIVKTCDAMEVNLLFVAAIVAFPAPWKRKLIALASGIGILAAVNLTRICSLYFVGLYAPSAFEAIHLEVWPLILVAVAVTMFVGWARWTSTPPATQPAA